MNTLMMQNSVSEANASYSYGSESSSPERQNDSMENASMGISSDTSEAEDSQGDAYYRD